MLLSRHLSAPGQGARACRPRETVSFTARAAFADVDRHALHSRSERMGKEEGGGISGLPSNILHVAKWGERDGEIGGNDARGGPLGVVGTG